MSAIPKQSDPNFWSERPATKVGVLTELPGLVHAPERDEPSIGSKPVEYLRPVDSKRLRIFETRLSIFLIVGLVIAWSLVSHSTLLASMQTETVRASIFGLTKEISRLKIELQERQSLLESIENPLAGGSEIVDTVLEGTIPIEEKDVVIISVNGTG